MVKAKLSSIVQGIDFQSDESNSYLNKKTSEVVLIADGEIRSAESDEDVSVHADWYLEAIERARQFLKNEQDYIPLPSQYAFHEYRVIEQFVYYLPIEEQREELLSLIKGKGAFSRFRAGVERLLLTERWYQYRDKALLDFAKDWCQDNDIEIETEN